MRVKIDQPNLNITELNKIIVLIRRYSDEAVQLCKYVYLLSFYCVCNKYELCSLTTMFMFSINSPIIAKKVDVMEANKLRF